MSPILNKSQLSEDDSYRDNPSEHPIKPPELREKPIVDANGCEVLIMGRTVSIYDTNGCLLRQENIVDYTRSNILGEYASLEQFIRRWTADEKKTEIRNLSGRWLRRGKLLSPQIRIIKALIPTESEVC